MMVSPLGAERENRGRRRRIERVLAVCIREACTRVWWILVVVVYLLVSCCLLVSFSFTLLFGLSLLVFSLALSVLCCIVVLPGSVLTLLRYHFNGTRICDWPPYLPVYVTALRLAIGRSLQIMHAYSPVFEITDMSLDLSKQASRKNLHRKAVLQCWQGNFRVCYLQQAVGYLSRVLG